MLAPEQSSADRAFALSKGRLRIVRSPRVAHALTIALVSFRRNPNSVPDMCLEVRRFREADSSELT
jgi:hypothetical protein